MNNYLLNSEDLKLLSNKLAEWEITKTRIRRVWQFKNFIEAFGFIAKVAMISEAMNHHPELSNIYRTVTIELTTHDLGGLSSLDVQLAQAIDSLQPELN